MQIITRTAAEALIALLLLVPIFELLNRRRFHNDQRTGAYLVFAAYLCAIYVVVGLPDIGYFRFRPNINLKPFQYMFSDLRSTVPNVFLFLPLGCFLPILWADFRSAWKTVFVGFLTSLTIELLQIFTFRATDVNDLMTNTLGTLLGYGFGRTIQHFFAPDFPEKDRTHISLVFGTAFAVMFFLHPPFSALIYRLLKW